MRHRSRGQGSTELMLLISVIGVTVVAASATMVPLFRSGVENLGNDVKDILSSGSVGGVGSSGNGVNNSTGGRPGSTTTGTSQDYRDALNDMVNGGANGRRANPTAYSEGDSEKGSTYDQSSKILGADNPNPNGAIIDGLIGPPDAS